MKSIQTEIPKPDPTTFAKINAQRRVAWIEHLRNKAWRHENRRRNLAMRITDVAPVGSP